MSGTLGIPEAVRSIFPVTRAEETSETYLIKNTFLIFAVSCDETLEGLLEVKEGLLRLRHAGGEVLFEGCEEGLLALAVPHQPSGHDQALSGGSRQSIDPVLWILMT